MSIEKLYKNYGRMLLDMSYRITQNRADAEEILQETFLEFWKRKPKGAIIAWLKKVVVNKSFNLIRDRKNLEVEKASPRTPEKLMEDEEKAMVVKKALSQLKPIENTVVVLKRYQGMSHKEIANILGISENNSRVIFYRAMKNLKEQLGSYIKRGNING